MNTSSRPDIERAEQFIWHTGRLLERLRFAALFRDGDPARTVDALRPYANPDGGFAEALEPDFRGPISQPMTVDMGLNVLDQLDAFDDPMVSLAYDYLQSVTTEEGGVPNTLARTVEFPHAPWWAPAPGAPASVLPTGSLVALACDNGVTHPWIESATAFAWRAVEELVRTGPEGDTPLALLGLAYRSRAAITFLDHAPDRPRAEALAGHLGPLLIGSGAVELDPAAPGEAMTPLDFAEHPDSLARTWFDDATIERHLDALIAAQGDDGGWPVPWPIWTPATEPEWRGILTVERLRILRSHGRWIT